MSDSIRSAELERRVPSVPELRNRAQGEKIMRDRRWSYRVFRWMSVYITWTLLHTSISANAVTVLSLLAGSVGLVLLAAGSGSTIVVAIVLLFAHHILDRVDGEIARARDQHSLLGIYLDNVGHFVTFGATLPAAALAWFRADVAAADGGMSKMALWVLVIGGVGGFSMMMARTAKLSGYQMFAQYVLDRPSLVNTVTRRDTAFNRHAVRESRSMGDDRARSFIVRIRDLYLVWTQYPTVITVLLVAWIGALVVDEPLIAAGGIVLQGLSQLLAWLAVEFLNIRGNIGVEAARLWDEARSSVESPVE